MEIFASQQKFLTLRTSFLLKSLYKRKLNCMEIPEFNKEQLFEKLQKYGRELGVRAIYSSLLLYYTYQEKETPGWARNIVLGALAYLINPFDVIPDLSPLVGYTDDLGILGFALVTISGYINMEVKINARKKAKEWFKEIDLELLKSIEDRLS